MSKSFRISPVYDRLLRGSNTMPVGLYQLHIATAEQLCRLHYSPKSIKWVKAKLKVLADNGFVQSDCIPTKFFKSPYYYTLGSRGIQYLALAGLDVSDGFRASKEVDKHALFVEHTLELNDMLIAASLLKRAAPRYYLHGFTHERVLKRLSYRATWKDGNRTQAFTVIPDAFLDFRLSLPDGRTRRMPLLLEHDRGTEEQHYFRRRIRAYITLLKSGKYTEMFGVRALTVAFSTFVGPHRLEQMRTWTRQVLADTNEPPSIGSIFLFATVTQPLEPRLVWLEPCWFASYDQPPLPLLSEI